MLDLEIQPERSIGNETWELILGMTLAQAINVIKSQDVVIRGVQFCYNSENPLANDLIINLSQDGIRLTFDSYWQRLKIIEIYNLTLVKLKYSGSYFNCHQTLPTIAQIDQSFGATHPAVYSSERKIMVLSFRGLTFEFKVESNLEPQYSHGLGSLQFPAGFSPLVSRMLIYSGLSPQEASCPALPISCFNGGLFLERLDVIREEGRTVAVQFHVITEDSRISHHGQEQSVTGMKTIKFGDSCQDVVSELGCPSKVFYKDEDKMTIHSAVEARRSAKSRCTDYFYNYFTLGVDIQFNGSSHQVKKFILHSNFPNHYNFNVYHRCYFHIPMIVALGKHQSISGPGSEPILIPVATPAAISAAASAAAASAAAASAAAASAAAATAGSFGSTLSEENKPVLITFDTKWNEVHDLLLEPGTKPVVLNRTSVTNTTNPFGSSFSYGVQDVIFEITSSQQIASVTLYKPTR